MSISVGVGILSRAAWGFVIFGILVLIDNFVIKSQPPAPPDSPLLKVKTKRSSIASVIRSHPLAGGGHSCRGSGVGVTAGEIVWAAMEAVGMVVAQAAERIVRGEIED